MLTQTEVYATRIAKKSYTEIMKSGRFMASLRKAARLQPIIRNGKEVAHSLPAGVNIPVYPVDALPGCPEDWVRGQGSYVCPVAPDWGLWFDYTMNDHLNTSILPSVKGMNPITGQKMNGLKLNQFKDKCPVHDVPFKGDERFCEKCDFRWPAQDYVASPNVLWIDGFRQPDGSVRQFFFTEDEERDVASAVIGEKNTVPAFGFAFFEPKVRREPPRMSVMRGMSVGPMGVAGAMGWTSSTKAYDKKSSTKGVSYDEVQTLCETYHGDQVLCFNAAVAPADVGFAAAAADEDGGEVKTSGLCLNDCAQPGSYEKYERSILRSAEAEPRMPSENAKVAVGAGTKIEQDLQDDPLDTKDWKDEPSAVIRLYFVFRAKFEKIMEKGVVDLAGNNEGYLKGVKVG